MNSWLSAHSIPAHLFSLVFVMFWISSQTRWAQPKPAEAALKAGVSVVDISPTNFPVIVNGHFTERTADKIVDPLLARALALSSGSNQVILCLVDTCMMPRDLIDRAKELARLATGIPASQMLISATHTHSAPAAMGCLGSRADAAYASFLPGRLAEAISQAVKNMVPARIGWAVADDWDHTFNRRWIRRPDKRLNDPFGEPTVRAHMHPGHQSPDAIGPSGPVDPGLSVLAVQTAQGKPLALLANYSQHYYGSPSLSSDYFGRFASHLAELLGAAHLTPPFVAMMSQGTSGDLMWMDYSAPPRDIGYDAYAKELAERAARLYQDISFRDSVPLRMAERALELNFRAPDEARLAWARKIAASLGGRLPQNHAEIYALEAIHLHERPRAELKLQALRIGDLGLTALPNEVYAITGLKLKAQSPLHPTFNIELANGAEGYIPPPEQHRLGGYTTWPARTAGLEEQAEPKIVEVLLSLLEQVAGKPRRVLRDQHGPYAEAILNKKPRAYWRLNEIAGSTARDASPNLQHATYGEGVALYLPGADDRAGFQPPAPTVPNPFSGSQINRAPHLAGGTIQAPWPNPGSRWSLIFWFWNGLPTDARPVTAWLVSTAAKTGGRESLAQLGIGGTENAAGRLIFQSARGEQHAGNTELAWRTWHAVALIRDGDRFTIHLNGQSEPEITAAAPASPDPIATLYLGGSPDGTANLEGKIDEAAFFDRALTQEEIKELFRLAAPPSQP